MKALILAAGLGSRLHPLTSITPKPLISVAGKAIIQRQIEYLKTFGFEEYIINLHHCPLPLKQLLGNGSQLFVSIKYSEEKQLLGTGGGIKKMLQMADNDRVLVLNGDVLFMPDISRIIKKHQDSKKVVSMILKNNPEAEKLGAVGILNNTVKRLVYAGNKSIKDIYMFTGMHVIEPDFIDYLPNTGCIVRDSYIPLIRSEKEDINAIVCKDYFCDLGSFENYLKVNLQLIKGQLSIPGFTPPYDQVLVGKNVKTGKNTTIGSGCMIGNNVTIDDNLTICESIIFSGATVNQNLNRALVNSDGEIIQV